MYETPVGLLLPDTNETDQIAYGILAEELGYASAWAVELWGKDAFVDLAVLAERTDTIRLGTAIVNVFSRSPAVLAMASRSMHDHSDGRFTLGTGVSTPKVVEDLHGTNFDRPVRRAHETIEVVRKYLNGDGSPVEYDNELVSVADFPSLDTDVSIYHAALGPANRRVVGRLADGWIPHNVPFSQLDTAFETIAAAARERGRNPENIDVAPYIPAVVEQDESTAAEAVRGHLAYYIGSGKGYERAVATAFPDEAERVAKAWHEGDRSSAREAVTDEMLADLTVYGTPETAPERLANRIESASRIDHAILAIPRQVDDAVIRRTVEVLAPGED